MLLQERDDVARELHLAVPAHPDPAPALRLHPLPVRIVRSEQVRVVREDGADVRVCPEAPLLRVLAAPAAGDSGGKLGAVQARIAAARHKEARLTAQIAAVTTSIRSLESKVGDVSRRLSVLEQDPEHGGLFLSIGGLGNTLDLFPCTDAETLAKPNADPSSMTGLGVRHTAFAVENVTFFAT